jgi:hypothetical protein
MEKYKGMGYKIKENDYKLLRYLADNGASMMVCKDGKGARSYKVKIRCILYKKGGNLSELVKASIINESVVCWDTTKLHYNKLSEEIIKVVESTGGVVWEEEGWGGDSYNLFQSILRKDFGAKPLQSPEEIIRATKEVAVRHGLVEADILKNKEMEDVKKFDLKAMKGIDETSGVQRLNTTNKT